MAGNDMAGILDTKIALDCGLEEIAELRDNGQRGCEQQQRQRLSEVTDSKTACHAKTGRKAAVPTE